MATLKTAYASGALPMPVCQGAEVITVNLRYDLAAIFTIGDILQFGFLPVDHVPVDYIIDNDDLSSTAAGTFDFGLLDTAGTAISTAAADGNGKWLTASALLQAAAFTRATPAGGATSNHLRVTPSSTTNRILAAVAIASCTVTATGVFAVIFSYRSANAGK